MGGKLELVADRGFNRHESPCPKVGFYTDLCNSLDSNQGASRQSLLSTKIPILDIME